MILRVTDTETGHEQRLENVKLVAETNPGVLIVDFHDGTAKELENASISYALEDDE